MTEIIMMKTGQGWIPADEHQAELLDGYALGDLAKVKFTKSRNLQFHRKYFALIGETFHMQDIALNKKGWRAIVQTGAGYCDFVKGKDDQLVAVPQSIAFHKMDDLEFSRLYSDSIDFICMRYVQDNPDHLRQVLEFA